MAVAEFVNYEVKELFSNGIVKSSRLPSCVVDKKGINESRNNKKRQKW